MNEPFFEIATLEDYKEREGCRACTLDEAIAAGNCVPAIALPHTCKDRFTIYEKIITCTDTSHETVERATKILFHFMFEHCPHYQYFKLRFTDSARTLNAKDLVLQWAVEK